MLRIFHLHWATPLDPDVFERLLAVLPADMQARIRRYRRWQPAQAGLLGKLLLIKGMETYGLEHTALRDIQYTPLGRPFLPGGIDFNISHAAGYAVCVLSDRHRVGIDIEPLRPVAPEKFRSYMTDREWEILRNAPDPERAFFCYWTQKEAALKAVGQGLHLPLTAAVLHGDSVEIEGVNWALQELPLYPEAVCHVVSDRSAEVEISAVEMAEMLIY